MKPDKPENPRLPEPVETLLSDWPSAEREPTFWQEQARAIDKKVKTTEIGSTDPSLLEAPLPRAASEQPDERLKDAPASDIKLADLARAVAQTKGDDLRDIAKQSLSLASRSRAVAVKHSVSKAQAMPTEPRSASADASEGIGPAATADSKAQKDKPPRRGQGLVGIAVGVLGLAAAVGMYVSTTSHVGSKPEPIALQTQADPGAQPEATRGTSERTEQPLESKPSVPQKRAFDDERRSVKSPPRPDAPAPPQERASSPVSVTQKPEPVSSFMPPVETVHLREEAEPAQPGARASKDDETSATRPAVSAPKTSAPPKLKPADGTSGPVAEKPSFGAATAALGAVMPAARACVASQKASIPATVVFGSDGLVKSVAVGGQTDTATRNCISGALKRARLQPFARPTFSISVSVRPR